MSRIKTFVADYRVLPSVLLFFISLNIACNGGENPTDPGEGTELFDVAKIARWDGSQWYSLGQGVVITSEFTQEPAMVNDIAIDEGLVYAAGKFELANTNTVNSIARWNGSDWQGFGHIDFPGVMHPGDLAKPAGTVNALVISQAVDFGKTLYVGGEFSFVVNDPTNALPAGNIAMFYLTPTISTWDILRSGVDGPVNAMDVNASGLFVGGEFSSANNGIDENDDPVPNTNLIARWDIGSVLWQAVGGGITGTAVHAITVDPGSPNGRDVYVGGQFFQAGNVTAANIAKWAGNQWESLGNGLNGTVFDIAVENGTVYAAGQFFVDDFQAVYLLALWNGSSWTYLGDRVELQGQQANYDLRGLSLAVNGNDIYLGGHFTRMDGQTVNHVARLNGNSWQDLTGGVHNLENPEDASPLGVNAITLSGNDVYVGGIFTAVGQ